MNTFVKGYDAMHDWKLTLQDTVQRLQHSGVGLVVLLQINLTLVDIALHMKFWNQPLPHVLKYIQPGALIFINHTSTKG